MPPDPTEPAKARITIRLDTGRLATLARLARYRTLAGARTVTTSELAADVVGRFVDEVGPVELPKLEAAEAALAASGGGA